MGYNFLIVDDSEMSRLILSRIIDFSKLPVQNILTAENGKEALSIMSKTKIDLLFLDINMPIMDGIETIENMTNDKNMQKIPIIVISSEGNKMKIEKLYNKGIRSFISKPFSPETIREAIILVLERAK